MQSEETVSHRSDRCRIIAIGSRGGAGNGKTHTKAIGIDKRFYSLDEHSQRAKGALLAERRKQDNPRVSRESS